MGYRERIRVAYNQLSAGYRRIADFLLEKYQEAAFMTAAEVARSVQVDTALVVRFAQRLGYPGYPELSGDVQQHVKDDLHAVYAPAPDDQSAPGEFMRALRQDRNNLEYMLMHLETGAIERTISLIRNAQRIFVSGEGSGATLAEMLTNRLVILGMPAHVVSGELAGQAAITATLRPGDLFIGIGLTNLTPGVSAVLTFARAQGADTVAIAGTMTNPVATAAETVLYAPVNTPGILPSWTAIAAVTHALTQALASQIGENIVNWSDRTDQLVRDYTDVLNRQLTGVRKIIEQYRAKPEAEGERPRLGLIS